MGKRPNSGEPHIVLWLMRVDCMHCCRMPFPTSSPVFTKLKTDPRFEEPNLLEFSSQLGT